MSDRKIKLSARGLTLSFGTRKVLEGVSFDVYEGEFLSVLGPSGCGKTTLLRVLLGLQKPDGGQILKDGEEITNTPTAARGMGVVFQNYALFENMTVIGNVEYALRVRKENRGKEGRARVRREALAMLERLGLSEHKDKKPSALSGGQMQRTAIARTLLVKPDILLFDEPMSALDATTRVALREELVNLHRALGTTVIYVTHDQEEAFAMSDRIMVMREASVVQTGTPREILASPADGYVKEFVSENLAARAAALSALVENEA